MVDRQASAQTTQLTELQTELKSLKSLIVARRPATPTPTSPSPAPDATATSSTAPASAATPAANGTDTSPFPARPFGGRAPGIPAWQRAAQPAAQAGSEVKDDPSGSGVLVGRPEEQKVEKEE